MMDRRTITMLSAIIAAGLVSLPGNTIAQQKSLKQQLVGAWTLVSAETTEANGNKTTLVKGAPIKGLLVFTEGGKVSYQVIGEHAKLASNDRQKMTPEEMKATAESVLAYFGSYTVNEAEKSITMQIDASSFQNQTAAPAKRIIEINGDDMKYITPSRLAGGQNVVMWKRAK
jgi:hypothetical protein